MAQKAVSLKTIALAGVLAGTMPVTAFAVNADGAKELARQNNCFNCHAVSKAKDGPSYKEVAAKYKGKPDAMDKLIYHVTSGEEVKLPDGHKEKHKIVKTDPPKDMAQIRNLIEWILSL